MFLIGLIFNPIFGEMMQFDLRIFFTWGPGWFIREAPLRWTAPATDGGGGGE